MATKKKEVEKTSFAPRIRSRHPSHRCLRTMLPKLPFRTVVRLGSTTDVLDTVSEGGSIIEVNTTAAVKNSMNKRSMKECFTLAGVKTADWFCLNDNKEFVQQLGVDQEPVIISIDKLPYPIVAKNIFGSRGTGNYKFDCQKDLSTFIASKSMKDYIFEKYYNFSKEYRLHVTSDGCFYTCRKALKKNVEENNKWQRHDDNCVWFTEKLLVDNKETEEENPNFQKPSNWNEIVEECKKALESVELDIASFDVRVQSEKNNKDKVREKCDFIIIECNSASSFGDTSSDTIVARKYLNIIPQIATNKAIQYGIIKK